MPTRTNTDLSLVERLLLAYDRDGILPTLSGGDHDPDPPAPPADPPADPPANPEPLGEPGKKALESEREARRAAEKAARDEKARADRLEAEARKRAESEAAEQGRWQELAEKREAELSDTTASLSTVTAELDSLRTYFTGQYTTALKELPEVIREFAPDDDAPFAMKAAWLSKAQAQAKKIDAGRSRGNGPNPKPGDAPAVNEQEVIERNVRSFRF
jgi:hypothetical protein